MKVKVTKKKVKKNTKLIPEPDYECPRCGYQDDIGGLCPNCEYTGCYTEMMVILPREYRSL